MLIANPLYDVVFKKIMENERFAKFFIGTLLHTTIESISVQPQEFTYASTGIGLSVYRIDFMATIVTSEGKRSKVLIEVQKARNYIDLMRFRSYLGEQYKKEDTLNGQSVVLPITTIYVLGFDLPDISSPCFKVGRHYTDLIEMREINERSEFAEKLTHDSYIIQTQRIGSRYLTHLDKLLSLFEQRYFVDNNRIVKEYHHHADLSEVQDMATLLHYAGTNPAERRRIEVEQEAWRTVEAMYQERSGKLIVELSVLKHDLATNQQALAEQEQIVAEQEKALAEQEKAIADKDRMIAELLRKINDKDA